MNHSDYVICYYVYHCFQHIKTDLDDISDERLKSITYTVNHAIKVIEEYLDEKDKVNQ
jgi:hypothetical protein